MDKRHAACILRSMPAKAKKPKPLRETPIQIRLTDEEKRTFEEAAEREHLTLSAWLRRAGLHAAESQHK